VALPPWSPSPHLTDQTFKKQSIVVSGIISHIHKFKENNASISPSMCFFASDVIDGLTINELVLIVEDFARFLITSSIYFFYKEKQIVNVTTSIIVKM
jgi:hypothetical protein